VHYRISSEILIKTENAAKPEKQSSSYLNSVISNLDPVSSSFDYGCGKLRYKQVLLRTTDTLALVDSSVQLERKQMICGEYTTVRQTVRQMLRPGCTCLFVLQYRNSDFTRMRNMPNARPWRDGFIIDSLRGFSFYGLIAPERLVSIVLSAGFEVVERSLNEGTVYLLARSPRSSDLPRIFGIAEERNFSFSK
jgi:hypothetical protein